MLKMITAVAMTSVMALAGGNIAPEVEYETQLPVLVEKNSYVGVTTLLGAAGSENSIKWFHKTTVGVTAGHVFYRTGDWATSVEARYSTDTQNWFDTYTYGAYLRPGYDFGTVTAYGLVGYQDGQSNDVFDFDGELAYGGGFLTEVYGYDVFVDYVKGDDTKSEVVTLGVNYKF